MYSLGVSFLLLTVILPGEWPELALRPSIYNLLLHSLVPTGILLPSLPLKSASGGVWFKGVFALSLAAFPVCISPDPCIPRTIELLFYNEWC